jgi:hypothetical protein
VSDPLAVATAIAEQIRRVERGEALLHQVSRARGY